MVTMQVEVVALPGNKPSFVKFTAKAAALIGPNLHNPYQLDFTQTITGGSPENLFNSVPSGTKHVVLNCHARMNAKVDGRTVDGITLFIAGNVGRVNCSERIRKVERKVRWRGGVDRWM